MRLARDTFFTFSAYAVPILLNLVTVPLYLAQIGPARYGALAIAWLLLGYFGQADFGIGRAITQRVAVIRGEAPGVIAGAVWTAIWSILAIGMIGGLLVYFGATYFFTDLFRVDPGIRRELLASTILLALCNPLVALSGVTSGALIGAERFKLVAGGNLVSNAALQIFPLLTAYMVGPNLEHLILAALMARVLALAIFGMSVWKTFLAGAIPVFSRSEFVILAKFGIWIMVSAIIGPLMIFADRFIIGAVLGAVAVAAYTIPFQMANRTLIVPISLGQVLFPRFASESGEAAHTRCRGYTVFLAQIFAPIIAALICLSGPLLSLWLGDDLDIRSVSIAQILLAGFWFNAAAFVPFAFIQARGNPRFTATLHLLELPVYAALLFGLGTAFGLMGVAAAFSLRCFGDFLMLALKARTISFGAAGKMGLSALPIFLSLPMVLGRTEWGMPLVLAAFATLSATAIAWWQMPTELRAKLIELLHSLRIRSISHRKA